MLITDQGQLEEFVRGAISSQVLAIDTEFLREKTYYPKLCLLQMQTDDRTVLVDPFAVRDLTVLKPLFAAPGLLKLFHAGLQDIEILYHAVGIMPRPVFDTQIAAALLGHTQQIGYGALVSSVCGVPLKKTDSYTDWSRRPLSRSQLDYAADDVVYLPKLHEKMAAELERLGRTHWLDEDFAALVDEANYADDARERWRRLKRVNQLSRKQLAAAREVVEWREMRARKANIPRKWVMSDEQVVEAVKREARTIDQLFMVRGMHEKLSTADAREVVGALARGLDLPADQRPALDRPSKNEANVDVEVDFMSALVRLRARQNNIAFQTLASHNDLAALARGYRDVDVLRGWRRDIVGAELLDLLAGNISLSMEMGNLTVTKSPQR
ncbi:ribonuclease D [Curtanaerobium respiraculi]|uniref:ribonuclease D n=1 Tax=Curtanaerobium respiraculi TaxID=2949669 RepID=UPI0024B3B252|nr:ribonuclease D [Curtanaerobium respiraculi]